MKDHEEANYTVYNGDQPLHVEVTLLKVQKAFRSGNGVEELGSDSLYDGDGKFRKGFVSAFPVNVAAINSLEVEENSLQLGATGSITLNNKFNILENFDFNNTIEYDLYIMITAFDPQIEKVGVSEVDNGFTIMGFCTNLVNASRDYNDNIVQFRWEEAFVNALRSISMKTVIQNWSSQHILMQDTPPLPRAIEEFIRREEQKAIDAAGRVMSASELLDKSKQLASTGRNAVTRPGPPVGSAGICCNVLTIIEHIYQSVYRADVGESFTAERYFHLFNQNVGTIIDPKSYNPNLWHTIFDHPDDQVGVDDLTVYDMVQGMLNETLVGDPDSSLTTGRCGYLRMVNTPSTDTSTERTTRRMVFAPFITDLHEQFMHEIKSEKDSPATTKFTSVYTEKFAFGPFAAMSVRDKNTSMFNVLEAYNIKRADVNALKNSIWQNYTVQNTNPDPGQVNMTTYYFSDLQNQYTHQEFKGTVESFNIPVLRDGGLKTAEIPSPGGRGAWDMGKGVSNAEKKQYAYAYSRVAKSFLTIAETMTFQAKGSMIRQPNKFVWLEKTSEVITGGTDQGKDKNGLLHKLGYVNRVKHIFSGQTYTNEIEVSKWTGNNDISDDRVEKFVQVRAKNKSIAAQEQERVLKENQQAAADAAASVQLKRDKELIDESRQTGKVLPTDVLARAAGRASASSEKRNSDKAQESYDRMIVDQAAKEGASAPTSVLLRAAKKARANVESRTKAVESSEVIQNPGGTSLQDLINASKQAQKSVDKRKGQ